MGAIDATDQDRRVNENLVNSGLVFTFGLWIQSQMVNLIILKKHPKIIKRFVARVDRIPRTMVLERARYLQKDFHPIKAEFEDRFGSILSEQARADLAYLLFLRNGIAHSYVSIARDFLMYRPAGGGKKLRAFYKQFKLRRPANAAKPSLLVFRFSDQSFFKNASDLIERLDQVHLKSVADAIGIPHGRVR
jgi:hypothetical protein